MIDSVEPRAARLVVAVNGPARPPGGASPRAARPAAILLAVVCLGTLAATARAPVAEHHMVADRDGLYLHVAHYRPAAGPSGVVLLVHDWGSSGEACWGALPGALAAAGFEVIVPDLPGHGRSLVPDLLQPVASIPTRTDAIGLARRAPGWLALAAAPAAPPVIVCVGWSGLLLPYLPAEVPGLHGAAWIAPPGDPWASGLEFAAETPPLLLMASQEEIAASRVAEALFSRFNPRAELRLYRRGPAGCGLLESEPARTGLLAWLRWVMVSPPMTPSAGVGAGEAARRWGE
jgi:pimeloyl-ACP methyl ester carboxylesterase